MKAFNFVTSFLVGFFVAQYVHNWFLIIGIGIAWIFILAIIDWLIDLTKLEYRRIREQVKREIMNQQYQKQQKRINDDIKRLVIRKEDVK